MDKIEKEMTFLYASDDNFAKVLGTSLYSLFDSNASAIKNIYIISQGISDDNKNKLLKIEKEFNKNKIIKFIDMPNFDDIIGEKTDIKRYSASMFSRILISSLLPQEIDRLIYLDCDIMINDSLIELWKTKLDDKVIGAINDYRSIHYQNNLNISNNNCYINSGVLLIDLKKYREHNLENRLINAIKKYNGLLEFPDNDAICKIAQNEIKLLPLRYNVTSVLYMTNYNEIIKLRKPHIIDNIETYSNAITNPAIVHFTTCFLMNGRPWINGCNHPLVDKYLYYYHKTPWKDEVLIEEQLNFKKKIKRIIVKILPRKIMIFACGIVHAYIKPFLQKGRLKPTREKETE